jgi:thiol-disulfide isomerase/thioredoxin
MKRWGLITALMIAAATPAFAQDGGPDLGSKAPPAKLTTIAGKPVDLADYIGKGPVVIEFWATWCPNCKELEPAMLSYNTKYGKQVTFIAVAVSVNETPDKVKAYVEKYKLPGVQLFDGKGAATGAYDVPATSMVVVVDKTGKVVYSDVGGNQPKLEAAIKKVL